MNTLYTIFLFLCLFASTSLQGQTNWKASLEKAQSLFEQGQYSALQSLAEPLVQEQAQNRERAELVLLLAKSYYIESDYYQATDAFGEAKAAYTALGLGESEDIVLRTELNRAAAARLAERYLLCLEIAENLLNLDLQEPLFKARALQEKAAALKELNNAAEALDYINAALQLFEAESYEAWDAQRERAIIYRYLKDYKSAIRDARQVLASSLYENLEAEAAQILAISYQALYNQEEKSTYLDSALYYNRQAMDKAKQAKENNIEFESTHNYVSLLIQKKDYSSARKRGEQARKLSALLHEEKTESRATLYRVLGQLEQAQGNYAEALVWYNKQLLALLPDYEETDLNKLPSIELCKTSPSPDALSDALAYIARVLRLQGQADKNTERLKLALAYSDLFDAFVSYLREEGLSNGSKLIWSDLSKDAYENALEASFALLQSDKEFALNKGFYYIEKSKSLALFEAFQQAKAKELAGLPEVKLKEEQALQNKLLELNSRRNELARKRMKTAKDSSNLQKIEQEYLKEKENYATWMRRLEQDYPEYYKLKHQVEVLNVQQSAALLADKQMLISYFVGDEALFIFSIKEGGEAALYRREIDKNFGRKIFEFRKSIYGFYLENSDLDNKELYNTYGQNFYRLSRELHELLIAPVESKKARLLILPDGPLGDMPFDVLISAESANKTDYKTHKYLIRDYAISYSYSASLHKEMLGRLSGRARGGYFLGVAPDFGQEGRAAEIRGKRFSFGPLMYNKEEVQRISEVLQTGKLLLGEQATEAAFRQLAGEYSILHIATHGMANPRDPDYSLLAFQEINDGEENEFLFLQDLYAMRLTADMVVLSACETGTGQLARGEGILSLARGFAFAGTKSILTTLWSVNDLATARIIETYYRFLSQGNTKDEALRLAKMKFLDDNEGMNTHPFLWSPYILIGDTAVLDMPTQSFLGQYWMYILGVLLVSLLFFFFIRGGKKS